MKRLKKWLLPLFTLLLVAAGAAMPFAVSYMQDARQAEAEERPFDSFSLTLQQQGAGLARLLKTVASGEYYVDEAVKTEDVTLSEGLALAAAEELMNELFKFGLLEKEALAEFFGPSIYPKMVIPERYPGAESEKYNYAVSSGQVTDLSNLYDSEGDAIPTWAITWDRPYNCYVWLDDASGKAIYIEVSGLPDLGMPDGSAAFGEGVYALAEKWRVFLSDYYTVDVQTSDEEWYDDAAKFVLSFPLGTGEDQEVFHLDLYLYFTDHVSVLSPYVS